MSKKLPPIHPGEILREDFMKPLGLSSTGLARALEVTPARVNEIVRERRGITADTALRLARFFGTDVQSWVNLQTHYDIQCAEDTAGPSIKRIRPRQASTSRPSAPIAG
jgi:addiction module HigA family antidote